MAVTTKNSELIPKEEIKAVEEFDKKLKNLSGTLKQILKDYNDVVKRLGIAGQSRKELAKNVEDLEKAEKKLSAAEKERARLQAERERLQARINSLNSEEAKAVRELQKELREKNKAYKEERDAIKETTAERAKGLAIARAEIEASKGRKEATEEEAEAERQAAEAIRERGQAIIEASTYYENNIQAAEEAVRTTQQLSESTEELSGISAAAREAFRGLNDTLQERARELVAVKVEQEEIKASQKSLDEEYKTGNLTLQEYAQRKAELISLENDLKIAAGTLTKQIEYGTQVNNTGIGSYDNLTAQYSLLKIEINKLTGAEGEELIRKKELEQQAKALREEMSRLQKETGLNTLDVGKYDIAVQDLTKTVSLVDYRLGAVVNRVKNISGFKKTWLKINDTLIQRLGVTAKTATILQAAILGLVVGGIVLAVNAIKDWIDQQRALIQLNAEVERTAMQAYKQEEIGLRILIGALQDANTTMAQRERILNILSKKTGEVFDRTKDWGEQEKQQIDLTEDYVEAMRKRALAQAAIAKITEIQLNYEIAKKTGEDRELSWWQWFGAAGDYVNARSGFAGLFNDLFGIRNEEFEKAREANAAAAKSQYDLEIQMIKDIIKEQGLDSVLDVLESTDTKKTRSKLIDYLSSNEKAVREYAKFMLEQQAEMNHQISTDSTKSYKDRSEALEKFIQIQHQLLQNSADQQIEDLVQPLIKAGKDRETALRLIGPQENLIREKQGAEAAKIEAYKESASVELLRDAAQERIKIITEEAAAREKKLSDLETAEIQRIAELYRDDIITRTEFEKQRTEIVRMYSQNRFDAEIAALEDSLEIVELTEEQKAEIQKKIADAQLEYQNHLNSQILQDTIDAARDREKAEQDSMKKIEEMEKQLAQARKQIISDLFNFASALSSRLYQNELNQINKLSEENSDYAKEQTERVERLYESGAISAEEADARKEAIAQRELEREEEFEEERKEIQRRQAIFELSLTVAQIGLKAAQAIAQITAYSEAAKAAATLASPATLGQPWVALISAQQAKQKVSVLTSAALETATALAQQIPAYARGTDDHPGGPAIVGDGGRAEMIILPGGEILKTPATQTMVNLPTHSMVMPDFKKAIEMLAHDKTLPEAPKSKESFINYTEITKLQREYITRMDKFIQNGEKNRLNQRYQTQLNYNTNRKLK